MASLHTLERRILALEARLADVEGGYGETLYKLHRASVKADLRTAKILRRLEIDDVSDEEIDAALDEEWALMNLDGWAGGDQTARITCQLERRRADHGPAARASGPPARWSAGATTSGGTSTACPNRPWRPLDLTDLNSIRLFQS